MEKMKIYGFTYKEIMRFLISTKSISFLTTNIFYNSTYKMIRSAYWGYVEESIENVPLRLNKDNLIRVIAKWRAKIGR